jgi:NADH:ubiquinone oxidoreductase subunit 5 (subunit L)/multisubunit Na+/H+ antiporter MnhA subunit
MLYLFRLFNGIFLGQRKISFSSKGRRSMVACVLFLGIVSLAIGLFIGQLLGLPNIAVAQVFR